jgi:tricorn protease
MSDAGQPAFDLNGKYLYFLASTDDGPSHAGIDLSSLDRAQTTAAYVVVLAKDGASPIPPESDDEKIKDEKKDDKKDEPKKDDDKKGRRRQGQKIRR